MHAVHQLARAPVIRNLTSPSLARHLARVPTSLYDLTNVHCNILQCVRSCLILLFHPSVCNILQSTSAWAVNIVVNNVKQPQAIHLAISETEKCSAMKLGDVIAISNFTHKYVVVLVKQQ